MQTCKHACRFNEMQGNAIGKTLCSQVLGLGKFTHTHTHAHVHSHVHVRCWGLFLLQLDAGQSVVQRLVLVLLNARSSVFLHCSLQPSYAQLPYGDNHKGFCECSRPRCCYHLVTPIS